MPAAGGRPGFTGAALPACIFAAQRKRPGGALPVKLLPQGSLPCGSKSAAKGNAQYACLLKASE